MTSLDAPGATTAPPHLDDEPGDRRGHRRDVLLELLDHLRLLDGAAAVRAHLGQRGHHGLVDVVRRWPAVMLTVLGATATPRLARLLDRLIAREGRRLALPRPASLVEPSLQLGDPALQPLVLCLKSFKLSACTLRVGPDLVVGHGGNVEWIDRHGYVHPFPQGLPHPERPCLPGKPSTLSDHVSRSSVAPRTCALFVITHTPPYLRAADRVDAPRCARLIRLNTLVPAIDASVKDRDTIGYVMQAIDVQIHDPSAPLGWDAAFGRQGRPAYHLQAGDSLYGRRLRRRGAHLATPGGLRRACGSALFCRFVYLVRSIISARQSAVAGRMSGRRIPDVGAMVVGKTSMHDLALGPTSVSTRNAWHPMRIPGGSAGAAATSMCTSTMGTEAGG